MTTLDTSSAPTTAETPQPGQWYVLQVRSGREDSAQRQLEALRRQPDLEQSLYETASPAEETLPAAGAEAGRNRAPRRSRLYPGYLLVRAHLNQEVQQAIIQTPGVVGFVSSGDPYQKGEQTEPTPLTPEEAARMTGLTAPAPARRRAAYAVGDLVEISDGPFAPLTARVTAIDERKGRVSITVPVFGRDVPAEMDLEAVQPIAPSP